MAKKPLTPDEATEVGTLENYVRAEERAEHTIDERVAATASPEPVEEPEPLNSAQQFLKDAREAQAVYASGNAISPDVLKSLVAQAVGIIAAAEEE